MTEPALLVEVRDAVATVTLNRPGTLNAIDDTLRDALVELADRLPFDRAIRAVVLTGAGGTFSSGGNVAHFEREWNTAEFRAGSHRLSRVFDELEALEKPVIAAIDGVATGAGLQLALAADLRFAAPDARLGFREHQLGLIPGHGGATRLVKLIGLSRAKELYFGGELVDAKEARRLGLVHRIVEGGGLLARAQAAAAKLARRAPAALGLTKRLLNHAAHADVGSGIAMESLAQSVALKTADHREGVAAFREKRDPEFRGE